MAKLPTGAPGNIRARLSPRDRRLVAWAAAIPSIPVAVAPLLVGSGPAEPLGRLGNSLLYGSITFAGLYLIIHFMLLLMRAGRDWNRRGGKPDPFSRG